MSSSPSRSVARRSNKRALLSYSFGFISSIILTVVAFRLVVNHTYPPLTTGIIIGTLALIQFTIQMIFFLHIGDDAKPRWKLVAFLSMLVFVIIVVFGSIWIMNSLNYRMNMSPSQMNEYMKSQSGI
jgi:cytochrome o ubiquinol oxidase operon protein cyoD